MGLFLLIMGAIGWLVGWVWVMVIAFSESVPWGIGIFLCSPVAFVFGILKWDEAKVPVILMAVGGIVHIIGRVVG
jgi:hypothetical protein